MTGFFQAIISFFPSINAADRSQCSYLETMGLLGLVIYAFAFPFSKDLCYVGEWMMLGAFLISLPRIWPVMKKDPVWTAFVVLFVYLLFKGILTLVKYSGELDGVLGAIRWRLRFLWIFMIAWWIGGSQRSLLRILAVSLIGFFVLLATGYEPGLYSYIERGKRIDFGINAQHFSLYAATALCGCLLLAKDFWGDRYRSWRIFIWSFLVFFFLVLTILAQTRATWIALIVVSIFLGVWFAWGILSRKVRIKAVYVTCGLIFFLLLSTATASLFYGSIHKRISRELVALSEMVTSDFDDIDVSTTLGKRIVMWKWAIETIREHPFIGWKIDDTSRGYLGQGDIDKRVARFHHVHNSYLEILLNQGIIGLLLFLFFPCYVIFSVSVCFKKGRMPIRFYMTFWSIVILFGMVNMFEAYFTTWLFWPYFTILFGGFYSIALWSRLKSSDRLMQ